MFFVVISFVTGVAFSVLLSVFPTDSQIMRKQMKPPAPANEQEKE